MPENLHPTIRGIRATVPGIFISLGLAIIKE
jgi:hypothetical protein